MSEFEVRLTRFVEGTWVNMQSGDGYRKWITDPHSWEIRRKPQYIMVNGFKVPKPLDVLPSDGSVYGAAPTSASFYATAEAKYEWARIMVGRGILHSTQAAAIAHAKAMLGLDPKWET